MKKVRISLIATLGVSSLLAALTLFIPLATDTRIQLALYTLLSLLHVGVAIMYLMGLKEFKLQFKVGYWYIAASMVCYAGAILELFILAVAQGKEPLVAIVALNYFAALPFFLYFALFYLGVRKLAQTIAIKAFALSWPAVLSGTFAVALIVMLLPLPAVSNQIDEASSHVLTGVMSAAIMLLLAIITLLFHLKQNVSVIYKPAFRWTFYSFLVVFISRPLDLVLEPLIEDYGKYGFTLAFFLSVACSLKAAYEFNRVPYAQEQLKTTSPGKTGPSARLTSVDVIIAITGLVSNPRAVDPLLDKLRVITSQLQPGTPLTDTQQVQIADIYSSLEVYLVQNEPARKYRSQDLRQLIEVKYRGMVNEPAFWQRFETLSAADSPQVVAPTPASTI